MRTHEFLVQNAIGQQRASLAAAQTGATPAAAPPVFASDIDVLNYALTLEHLEAAFYEMASDYEFGQDAFGNPIGEWLMLAGQQEAAHVTALTDVITQLGGAPVIAANYDFGVTDAQSFLNTAAAIENLGVSAYDGAASFIENPDVLTAAGTIVAVEARHASYLNLLTQLLPWPGAFENALPPEDVLATASQFIVGS